MRLKTRCVIISLANKYFFVEQTLARGVYRSSVSLAFRTWFPYVWMLSMASGLGSEGQVIVLFIYSKLYLVHLFQRNFYQDSPHNSRI